MMSNRKCNPHDWPEDFPHENGNYLCKCTDCEIDFIGYKRHTVCKACVLENREQAIRKLLDDAQKLEADRDKAHTKMQNQFVELVETQEENKGLRTLLEIARCPNASCIDGAIPHGPDPDGNWEAEQCQWCDERQQALKEGE